MNNSLVRNRAFVIIEIEKKNTFASSPSKFYFNILLYSKGGLRNQFLKIYPPAVICTLSINHDDLRNFDNILMNRCLSQIQ